MNTILLNIKMERSRTLTLLSIFITFIQTATLWFYALVQKNLIKYMNPSSTFSCRASLISWMPVLLMNSGSSNGGFSMPLFPCRYFLLKHQWRGTGTVFLVAFRWTSSLGSCAVTSCISTTSGRATSWQTEEGANVMKGDNSIWPNISTENSNNSHFETTGPCYLSAK